MRRREDEVQRALQQRGIAVSGLKVRESGRILSLWGTVENDADRRRAERVVADTMRVHVANHLAPRGDAPADAPATLPNEDELADASGMFGGPMQSRRYIAKPGDTLQKVARQFYGCADAWQQVLEANRERIAAADALDAATELKSGTELIVP